MKTFIVAKPYGFELRAATEFYEGFVPGSGMAAAGLRGGLTLAFRLDRTFEAVAVALRQEGRSILAEYAGSSDGAAVERQVVRMLGLGADGHAWRDVGLRDPVVGKLQAEFPGFFTAAKPSPYDAATWAVIAPRMNLSQAARVKRAMATSLGDSVELAGARYPVFPAPAALAALAHFPGLSDEKVARLRGIAEAALAGRLDAERLRDLGEAAALNDLQTLRGIGPWSASHVFYRGAAPEDALPTAEPRVLRGFAHAYGLTSPGPETFRRAAAAFRPFRMWVAVLLSRHLARAGKWSEPGLAAERATAGRALSRRARANAAA